EHLGGRRLLRVEHLATQREDRLEGALATLLRRAAGGIALDDEELALGGIRRRAVGELAGQIEAVRHAALALHLLRRGARRGPRARGKHDPARDGVAGAPIRVARVLERRA